MPVNGAAFVVDARFSVNCWCGPNSQYCGNDGENRFPQFWAFLHHGVVGVGDAVGVVSGAGSMMGSVAGSAIGDVVGVGVGVGVGKRERHRQNNGCGE